MGRSAELTLGRNRHSRGQSGYHFVLKGWQGDRHTFNYFLSKQKVAASESTHPLPLVETEAGQRGD